MPTAMLVCMCLFFCSMTVSAHAAANTDSYQQLEHCLKDVWGLDSHTVDYLVKKIMDLTESTGHAFIIDDFIAKSKALHIDFTVIRDVQPLCAEDAILCAPKQHLVIFENLYVRILWGSTAAGEREPFHVHPWKSLLLVLQPTVYEIEYPNRQCEQWNGQIGVYELPANDRYSCTNVGIGADEMIRFEVKE